MLVIWGLPAMWACLTMCDIVIFIYSHYPLDPNAKLSDTRWFCIWIERVMTVNKNYNVIAFKSCIQKFTVKMHSMNLLLFRLALAILCTKCVTLSIRWFCIRIERVMTVYGNYDVIAFKSCIQIFTVYVLHTYMYV